MAAFVCDRTNVDEILLGEEEGKKNKCVKYVRLNLMT